MTPEYLLSSDCLYREPELFFDNYRKNLNSLDAKPNATHLYLKKLEDAGKLKAIITQNIDGLHQEAGSKNVLEIHGTLRKCHCTKCGRHMVIVNDAPTPLDDMAKLVIRAPLGEVFSALV